MPHRLPSIGLLPLLLPAAQTNAACSVAPLLQRQQDGRKFYPLNGTLQSQKQSGVTGRLQMQRRVTWLALLSTAIVMTALYHARTVQATPAVINLHVHEGCSVASLKGAYAFRRTGANNVVGGPIGQIGIDVFNGDGTRGLIRTARSTNGEIRDWINSTMNGSYTVDPDCTGAFFDADGTKSEDIVVFDGGKRFFVLSVAPDTIVTEEGIRLEGED
jgi:hypothetical protein